jgi:hypothetical protein
VTRLAARRMAAHPARMGFKAGAERPRRHLNRFETCASASS